jgi:pentatricopeptide repeat protein
MKDIYSYNIILRSVCSEKKLDAINDLLLEMKNLNVNKDIVTYNTLGDFYAKNG